MKEFTKAVRRIAATALLLVIGLPGCILRSSPATSPILVGYLRALVSRNYSVAYSATTLPRMMAALAGSKAPSTAAITEAHFAAFQGRNPLLSYRITWSDGVALQAEMRRKDGVSTEALGLEKNRVGVSLDETTLSVGGGPLPALSVDGVPAKVRAHQQRITTLLGDTGLFDNQYDFYVIEGEHILSAPEGPATAAFTRKLGPSAFDLSVGLKPGASGTRSADQLLEHWKKSCGSHCTLRQCGDALLPMFFAVPVPVDGMSFHVTDHKMIGLGRTGWSIAVAGTARAGSRMVPGSIIVDVSASGAIRLQAECLGELG